jgi:transcriptional regulator with XRE-family HTH domain
VARSTTNGRGGGRSASADADVSPGRPGGFAAGSRGGPVVARLLLGAQLRRLREARGITRADAGDEIRAPVAKISRIEHGQAGATERDVGGLLAFYGVHDARQRAGLLALARTASADGWWAGHGQLLPRWFETYVGLEQAAWSISTYEVQFVPGLLQTADYARAVTALDHRSAPAGQIEQRVQLRLTRQQLLASPGPPRLSAVIDEAALRRPLGGPAVMRAQLRHLIQVAGRPGITVQIMPLRRGGHPAAGGAFTILRFAEPDLPDVVYLEQLTSALYLRKRDDIGHYLQVMDRLSTLSEPAERTPWVLQQIMKTM